jgi:hypothetical protein
MYAGQASPAAIATPTAHSGHRVVGHLEAVMHEQESGA